MKELLFHPYLDDMNIKFKKYSHTIDLKSRYISIYLFCGESVENKHFG